MYHSLLEARTIGVAVVGSYGGAGIRLEAIEHSTGDHGFWRTFWRTSASLLVGCSNLTYDLIAMIASDLESFSTLNNGMFWIL